MSTDTDRVHKREGGTTAHHGSSAREKFREPLLAYLAGGLEIDDKRVRVMAAGMLGSLGDPGAAEYLLPLAAGLDADLRAAAIAALGQLEMYPAMPATGPYAVPCGNCMIRFIAEEVLAHQKKSAR
jgi:HEAT repeat protein